MIDLPSFALGMLSALVAILAGAQLAYRIIRGRSPIPTPGLPRKKEAKEPEKPHLSKM
jgi:hypothetical protein